MTTIIKKFSFLAAFFMLCAFVMPSNASAQTDYLFEYADGEDGFEVVLIEQYGDETDASSTVVTFADADGEYVGDVVDADYNDEGDIEYTVEVWGYTYAVIFDYAEDLVYLYCYDAGTQAVYSLVD